MPQRSRITVKERQRILALIAEKKTDGEIAKIVGRGRSTITKIRVGAHPANVTTGGKMIHARVSDEEFHAFKEAMRTKGLASSEGVRRLIRIALDLLDLDDREINLLDKLRRELNAIGVNINQLASLGQSGRLKWNARDSATLDRLDDKLEVLAGELVAVVGASRRKTFLRAVFPLEADE